MLFMVAAVALETENERQARLRLRLARVVEELRELGVSTNQAARQMGVDQSTLRRQMSGRTGVDEKLVYRLESEADLLKARLAAQGQLPEGVEAPRIGVPLPLIGLVNAGSLTSVEEHKIRDVRVDPAHVPRGKAYVLRVEGRSMSPTLEHGDLVVVDADAEPRPRDIVVVTIPGQGTVVRRLVVKGKRALLEADGEGYEPYPRDEEEVLIHGVVHAIVGRSLR